MLTFPPNVDKFERHLEVLALGEIRVIEVKMAFVECYVHASFSLFWLDHAALARLQICPLRASSIAGVEASWYTWRGGGSLGPYSSLAFINAPPLLRRHSLLLSLLPSPFVALHRSGYHQLRFRHSLLHSFLLRAISDLSAQPRS